MLHMYINHGYTYVYPKMFINLRVSNPKKSRVLPPDPPLPRFAGGLPPFAEQWHRGDPQRPGHRSHPQGEMLRWHGWFLDGWASKILPKRMVETCWKPINMGMGSNIYWCPAPVLDGVETCCLSLWIMGSNIYWWFGVRNHSTGMVKKRKTHNMMNVWNKYVVSDSNGHGFRDVFSILSLKSNIFIEVGIDVWWIVFIWANYNDLTTTETETHRWCVFF